MYRRGNIPRFEQVDTQALHRRQATTYCQDAYMYGTHCVEQYDSSQIQKCKDLDTLTFPLSMMQSQAVLKHCKCLSCRCSLVCIRPQGQGLSLYRLDYSLERLSIKSREVWVPLPVPLLGEPAAVVTGLKVQLSAFIRVNLCGPDGMQQALISLPDTIHCGASVLSSQLQQHRSALVSKARRAHVASKPTQSPCAPRCFSRQLPVGRCLTDAKVPSHTIVVTKWHRNGKSITERLHQTACTEA